MDMPWQPYLFERELDLRVRCKCHESCFGFTTVKVDLLEGFVFPQCL